jgi:hypothetical protein
MIVRRFVPSLLLLALPLAAVACGGGDEKTVELPGGGQVNVSPSGGGITVEGPSGGQVNIGTGNYPDAWPSDFPVPEGATPAYSIGAADSVSVWFASDQSTDEIKSFYQDALPAAGYSIDSQADLSDTSGSYSVFSITGNGWTGGIYIGAGAGAVAAGFGGDFDFFVSLSPAS